ncbi:MAG: hypothetical protein J3Q66DRAFT_341854 [Benniella sp.]|nr:MAG: hypothetical protein J3Q66DRAFT_341854 [Benniella sp.]
MRCSETVTLIALSSLALLATSRLRHSNTHGTSLVSAALTAQERLEVEAKDPNNPNYCPACLAKAMNNHFPHACPRDYEPIEVITRPEGPLPHEKRCVCIAFLDLYWMKPDCSKECPFVHDAKAMEYFVNVNQIAGCDKWVDLETKEEKIVEGFEKRNPDHQPEKYPTADAGEESTDQLEQQEQVEEVVLESTENGQEKEDPEGTKADQVNHEKHTKDEL